MRLYRHFHFLELFFFSCFDTSPKCIFCAKTIKALVFSSSILRFCLPKGEISILIYCSFVLKSKRIFSIQIFVLWTTRKNRNQGVNYSGRRSVSCGCCDCHSKQSWICIIKYVLFAGKYLYYLSCFVHISNISNQ